MDQNQRIHKIKELLDEKEVLKYQDIMKIFGISRDTARRDIVKMVDLGLGLRTHGGIMIKSQERMILDYKERQKEHISLKKEIARKALSYISIHKVIYFDVSTTINALCDLVPSHIIGYTNSLANVESLSVHCETHMIGGKYNPRGRFMFGPDAYKAIEGITFDLCFLGAACVKEDGIYFQDEDDAYMKHLVASRSHFVCVLYDDSKYLKKGTIKALDFRDVQMITTNKQPPEKIFEAMKEAGCLLDYTEEETYENSSI